MRRKNLLIFCVFFVILILQDCNIRATAFAFSETDFDKSDVEFEAVVDDRDYSSRVPVRYRMLNDIRQIKRYYCGVNVDCPHETSGREGKQKDLKIHRLV
ncbi:hypothetical protein WA171_007271 [Blastocystis sp. BT1]